jgi:hypothetical protein
MDYKKHTNFREYRKISKKGDASVYYLGHFNIPENTFKITYYRKTFY